VKKNKLYIILFSIILIFCNSCSKNNSFVSQSFFALDTLCTIKVPEKNKEILKELKQVVLSYDKNFNRYKQNSLIFKLNKDKKIKNKELFKIISYYKKQNKKIKKYFKINMASVIDLWRFNEGGVVPEKNKIEEKLGKIKNCSVLLKNNSIKIDGDCSLDLGGILKGYILDKVVRICNKNNMKRYVINLGGDVAVKGENVTVGIKDPDKNGILTYIELNKSPIFIVTSGNYERYFEKNDIRYHHILNPKTGFPARGVKSVTYLSTSGIRADLYSTAIFAMGKSSKKFINNIEKDGILVIDSNNIRITKNLEESQNEKGKIFYKY